MDKELQKIFTTAEAKNMSIALMAKLSGVHRNLIRAYRDGVWVPTYRNFVKLKAAVKGYRG